MRKLVYVSHPYGGLTENRINLEDTINTLEEEGEYFDLVFKNCSSLLPYSRKQFTFISPVHAFGFRYEKDDYIDGLEKCIDLLEVCDIVLMCLGWEESKGCVAEYFYALAKGKEIVFE